MGAVTEARKRLQQVVTRQVGPTRLSLHAHLSGIAVAAVPTANREKFKKHADEAAAIFKEYGALSVVECWGDDVPEGKITSFPWRSSARTTRPWGSRGSSGHQRRCARRRGTR